MWDTAATNPTIPIEVWINLNTSKLVLGVFGKSTPFYYKGQLYERLGYL